MKKTIVRRAVPDAADELAANSEEFLLSRLYKARGEQLEAGDYVLRRLLPPESLKGLDAALDLLCEALREQRRVLIVGDFDCDGATSTAVLYRCLRAFGLDQVSFLVPNRFEYGYGLTPEIVELALGYRPELIITVDNGISSVEGVAAARAMGIRVLVTDHHLPGKILPDADAIVNPNQPGCNFPSKNLAGVGVVFYLTMALRARLREENWFETRNIADPNLAQFLDLVALGTVADVVPLDFNNRVLVAQGLQRIRAGACCAGIRALFRVAKRNYLRATASEFGFCVAPRLNAAGRLDDMSLGIRCLLSDNEAEALQLAQELDDLNRERRAIEASMKKEALSALDDIDNSEHAFGDSGLCLYRADWHPGVVGILAARVKDRMHRPAIVFSRADDGELKGSGRSIPGVHLRDVLYEIASSHPGLLRKFGGHAMAAGLSLHEQDFAAFVEAFDAAVAAHLSEDMKQPILMSDGELDERFLTLRFARRLQDAGPWGQAFPEPMFDGIFRVVSQKIVGENHLKLVLAPKDFGQNVYDAIAFGVETESWPNPDVEQIRVAYRLDLNEFMGKVNLQLRVEYLEAV